MGTLLYILKGVAIITLIVLLINILVRLLEILIITPIQRHKMRKEIESELYKALERLQKDIIDDEEKPKRKYTKKKTIEKK